MMATVPMSSSSLLPLLGTLEDIAAGVSEQTDAYLTIANRLSGEDGRQFFPLIVKHFSRLGKAFQTHISSENEELRQAALQALGFCVFSTHIVSGIPANFAEEILLTLCALVLKSTDKNTCTRALWVISKQNFSAEVVAKKTPEILKTLEALQTKDIQSVLTDHESLNVVIKLLEQAPVQMGEGAVLWIKLIVPLVVHSASKVRLRAAAALEMGMPLLLQKQQEVAAIVEPMMSSKLIPEMQKLFSTKNESNVLKLWPLFVKLLGKLLHKGGAFINSLLYLEELGFRSSSPSIKKIAFLAWKSLIDNFALNPDILCSSKRLKLLMQPLSSILVRTEALLLTKLEVWWYLVVKLGPNLSANFEQVGVPLLLSTLPPDASSVSPATPARNTSHSNGIGLVTPKPGGPSCSSPGASSHLSLNSSVSTPLSYASIQLLGLEMLLHYFLGSQASAAAAKNNLQLSLEPLTHNLLTSHSFFSKHSSTLISAVRDGFISVGKDAPEALLRLIWTSLVGHVNTTIEAAGNKKERQGSEVLTLLLQALQSIVSSEALPAPRALALLEATVKAIPQKVLGSAAYQVANMDVLNGTPALFLILLFYKSSMLSSFVTYEGFFVCLETLVTCGLCGPTSPLAFGESVLGTVSGSVESVENKEHLWRMWSVVVNPLTDTITQTNEVNQGDALEHNFSAIHSALMFPITHLLPGSGLPQMTQKTMLSTWSRLYKAFARCSALVATAEENVCCEELCARISSALDSEALKNLSTLDAVANILMSIIENVDFSPFTPQFQQKMKSPHTPLRWVRKRNKALGNLSTFHALFVQSLEVFITLASSEANSTVLSGIGAMLFSIVSILFTNISLPTVIQESLASLTKPLALLYGPVISSEGQQSKTHTMLAFKLEKLVGDVFGILQTRSAVQYNDELLEILSPLLCVLFQNKSKHIRSVMTQFWNGTFGNALVLTYPDSLRPVLNQAKQKSPLILPGFRAVENSEDFSGQCSSECSQLDTKISGMMVTSVGKRESLLTRAAELQQRSSGTPSKPVSVKLDFGSPKPPHKEVLEEEASVDFVFIPPEAKERVLTEHQKEVKRTKRVDIPAMYNNLDASLDTTVFTQYTQSQEESMDKLPTQEQAEAKEIDMTEAKDLKDKASYVIDDQKVQDNINPDLAAQEKATIYRKENQTTEVLFSLDVTASDAGVHQDSESQSPNVSSSSDMISGTPPKPSSRRQSFITLEKYGEDRPTNSASVTKFTGPLSRTSFSQEPQKSQIDSNLPSPSYSQPETGKEVSKESAANITEDSTNKSDGLEIEAELSSVATCPSEGTEDDVIPDTQNPELTEVADPDKSLDKSSVEVNTEIASPGRKSEVFVASQDSSPVEPRRSGRRRSRPVLPGEVSDQDSKGKKKLSVNASALNDAQKPAPVKNNLPTRTRRSRVHEENKSESVKLQNLEQKDERRDSLVPSLAITNSSRGRKSRSKAITQTEQSPLSSSDDKEESPLNQSHSQSHGRPVRRTRLSNANADVSDKTHRVENSQEDSPVSVSKHMDSSASDADSQSPARPRRARRSEAAEAQNKEKPGLRNEQVCDPGHAQTPTTTKVKSGRRKKANEENSECSQVNDLSELQDNSQGRGKYRTRRSSQALLASGENSESDASDTRDGQKPKRARGYKSPEITPSAVINENAHVDVLGKEDEGSISVPMEVPKNDPEACLVVGPLMDILNIIESADKVEAPVAEIQANEHYTSDVKSADDEQQSDSKIQMDSDKEESVNTVLEERTVVNEALPSSQNSLQSDSKKQMDSDKEESVNTVLEERTVVNEALPSSQNSLQSDSKKQMDSDKEESVNTVLEERTVVNEALPSSQNSLQLAQNVEVKSLKPRKCPHSKRSRWRRQSTNCKCLQAGSTPSKEECSNSQDVQNITENMVQLESSSLPPEAVLNSITSVLPEKESVVLQDNCPTVANAQSSSSSLPIFTEAEVPAVSLVEKPNESISQSSDVIDAREAEECSKDTIDDAENKHEETEQDKNVSKDKSTQEQPEEDPGAPEVSPSPSQSVEDKPMYQEQSESPVSQEEIVHSGEETEMPEKEELVPELEGAITALPEGTELDRFPQEEGDDGEATQIDNDLQPETALHCEASVPLQTALSEACLDSPPKEKSSDSLCGNTEVRQSPSNSVTRGVWSPSASPSTSILKKGLKRQCEEDTPSPLIKSRRVSFANPIYQQELADDIDRRSPVIRTSSPKSKAVGQPKYITTPTKGLLSLSPRNLRTPGYKSSKKCLISEMSQEPRPIPKDCVYPALVCCSTPVEAVLPQISSAMWPRGFGQLVRARNIKTVGDLSALSPNEIKLLPIRSPKVSNLKKALKTYYEQQRKGRPDDLKSFDVMEKMTSEPEETPAAPNEEDQMSGDGQEILSSEMPSTVEQKQEEPMPVDLLSDVAALGSRLTHDELSRCSPMELGLMHEQLSGMMRSIVDHLQSRLVSNLEDSLS
ncbi:telomere-associated protein RIF1 isoform X2 [Tachysurus vachellii]|uniref:telomere-associated protein RIF1 isoform X2 n=1 Tax=Tachysurus vachellii TaxID=175792 RepID=UPI00296B332C|nr:telomere-associated protein RIF1 isoform X2 [Tachysurus vachellii]